MFRFSATARLAALNVPVVIARRYRWTVVVLLTVTRCVAGAADTAANVSSVVQVEPSGACWTVTVTDVPVNWVTCRYACAPHAV